MGESFLPPKKLTVYSGMRGPSLRRRFIQNQENISFTIMALIPTLGKQILEEMDVEVVTHELQTKSRAFRTPSELPPPPPPPLAPPSESSSIDLLHEHEAPSDVESVSASTSSVYGQDDSGVGSFNAGESSQSWVDQLSTQSSQPSASWRPSSASEPPLPDFMAGVQLSDSITTASSALSYGNANGDGQDMVS
jgi:peroxin-3